MDWVDYSYECTFYGCQYTIITADHTQDKQPEQMSCTLHLVGNWVTEHSTTLCTSFHIFIVSHISSFIYHYQALFRSSAWCCKVSLLTIFRKHDFDHFAIILFKRHSCKILFSNFVYLSLDRITNIKFLQIFFLSHFLFFSLYQTIYYIHFSYNNLKFFPDVLFKNFLWI